MKGFYQYLRDFWKKPEKSTLKQRMIEWRKDPVVKRIENPTKPQRARSLGYKAKQGFVVVRCKVKKGGRKRRAIKKGRKQKTSGISKFTPEKNLMRHAEEKAARKYRNTEVLNSYFVAKDGQYNYYEVILVDKNHPRTKKDKDVKGVIKKRGRAFRGLTSAAKRNRK